MTTIADIARSLNMSPKHARAIMRKHVASGAGDVAHEKHKAWDLTPAQAQIAYAMLSASRGVVKSDVASERADDRRVNDAIERFHEMSLSFVPCHE